MRGPAEIVGNRVIDIAEVRRTVTPGKAACQIAATNEVRQHRRRAVTRLRWTITVMNYRAQFGDPAGRKIGENIGRHRCSTHHEPEPRRRTRHRRPGCLRAAGLPDHLHQTLPGGDHLDRVVLNTFTMHNGAVRRLQHRRLQHRSLGDHMHHHRWRRRRIVARGRALRRPTRTDQHGMTGGQGTNASARRCSTVRGSSSHTVCASALSRRSSNVASV